MHLINFWKQQVKFRDSSYRAFETLLHHQLATMFKVSSGGWGAAGQNCSTYVVPSSKGLPQTGLWLHSTYPSKPLQHRKSCSFRGFYLKTDILMFHIYSVDLKPAKNSKLYFSGNPCLVSKHSGRSGEQFLKHISLFWWVCIYSIFFFEQLKLFLFLLCVHLLECL